MFITTTEFVPNMCVKKVLGLVVGSNATLQLPLNPYHTNLNQTIENFSKDISKDISKATKEMEKEARLLNADAVIGVKITTTALAANTIFISAVGTAVQLVTQYEAERELKAAEEKRKEELEIAQERIAKTQEALNRVRKSGAETLPADDALSESEMVILKALREEGVMMSLPMIVNKVSRDVPTKYVFSYLSMLQKKRIGNTVRR